MSDFCPVFSLLFHFVPLPSPIASPAQAEKMKRREPLPYLLTAFSRRLYFEKLYV
ncbi:hypothetical protein HMPREF3213_00693 [Heyndrickxia coagulans]|uniref:Uncharacterized protein n=1 Tax=Heyndrickxia coagulans TaxID=1398 RepID=A0A133KZC1_HEYCO|nr:hypothetical protein HMPREF3213_00693 [Heyndrickxia coagulans]